MSIDLENLFLNALEDNKDKLFRICCSYASNKDDAKDIFQEVLINIWKSLPDFKRNSSISTWMYRITLNVNLRYRANLERDKKKTTSLNGLSIELLDYEHKPDTSDSNQKKLDLLRRCVRMLNDIDKAIISLYLEGLPYKEISSIIGLKENTIAVRIKRIKGKLLDCINDTL